MRVGSAGRHHRKRRRKTVEFKQDIPKDVMRYIPTVVAFSNTIGGTMIFGVSDSGEVTGIE